MSKLVDNILLNKYKDPERNRFAKTNLFFMTNPYLITQDPVFIGFRLMFDWSSPLLNLNAALEEVQPPLEESPGILDQIKTLVKPPKKVQPKAGGGGVKNCAYSYLLSIGELERAAYLKKFVEVLRFIDSDMSWYFQTIEGLDEAWKRDFNNPKIVGELTIGCLEDATFKMTGLIDLYRKACFDYNNMREIVPKNLRKFGMAVYVFDGVIRPEIKDEVTFEKAKKGFSDLKNANPKDLIKDTFAKLTGPNDKKLDVHSATRTLFHFHHCQINLESGSSVFASLSNAEHTMGAQNIKIDYRGVSEENLYHIFGSVDIADTIQGKMDVSALDANKIEGKSFKDGLFDKATQVGSGLAQGFVNSKVDKLKTKIAGMVLDAVGGIGGNDPSLSNYTKDIKGEVTTNGDSGSLSNRTKSMTSQPNGNDESSSLSGGAGTPSGNVNDKLNSPSLSNDTDSATGNVYE